MQRILLVALLGAFLGMLTACSESDKPGPPPDQKGPRVPPKKDSK